MGSNHVPSVFYPSPNEWPVTVFPVTNITRDVQATVTCPNHGMTNATDANTTNVNFSQVKGMQEINGPSGYVQNVLNANQFTVAINTTFFSSYTSGGFMNKIDGHAPFGPFENLFP